MEEIWKSIPRYSGYAEASNFGRIKILDSFHKRKDRILEGHKIKNYLGVIIYINCIPHFETIHYLILEAFTDPKEYKLYAKHIDGDNLNNYPSNLEWSSVRAKLCKPEFKIYQFDLNMNFIKEWSGIKDVCKSLNLNRGNMISHLNNRKWHKTCCGFIFKKERNISKDGT